MNQFALRMYVRSLINEAKEKSEKEPKKTMKKEDKAPKSDGKLVDLKKELAALEQYKEELQAAKFAEKTASTEVEFANLAHFAKELAAIKERGVALEQEVDSKIAELKEKITDAKNKIKEMMGLTPEKKGKKKMMGEEGKPKAPSHEETDANQVYESRFKKGTDIGKKGPGFAKIEKAAAKKYSSEEAGKRVAGAILKKVVKK
jgi:hypothetical protein